MDITTASNYLKNSKTEKTVLLSPVGGQAFYGIIQYFKKNGYRIIGIDSNINSIGKHFVDKFYQAPLVSDKNYDSFIYDLIGQEKIDIYISWLDLEIHYWNRIRSNIPEKYLSKFYINFFDKYEQIFNKNLFYKELQNKGFSVPDFINNPSKYPIIGKPYYGSGSRGILKINNKEEYNLYSKLENYLFQEFISGIEYTVDFSANKGKLYNAVIRKRNVSKGVCLDGEIVYDDKLKNIVKDFCQSFNISGVNNIQFLKNSDNPNYYIIDYNPRPSGTIMLSIEAGVDFFKNYIQIKNNEEITIYNDIKKLKMIRYYKEFYYV